MCFIVPIIFGNNLKTRRNYLAFLKFVNVVRVLSVFCQNEILMRERDFKDTIFFFVSFFFFLDDFGKILAISERFYIFYFFFKNHVSFLLNQRENSFVTVQLSENISVKWRGGKQLYSLT